MARHWYFQLLREEKEINKNLLKMKKIEEKRNMKKMAKQWQLNYDNYFDADYEDFDNIGKQLDENSINKSAEEPYKIFKGFEDVNEMVFFEENKDKMKYHKKTLVNLNIVVREVLSSSKVKNPILNNIDISVSELKMNKAMTVLYIYYLLPELENTKEELVTVMNEETDEIKKVYTTFKKGDKNDPKAPYQLNVKENQLKEDIYKDINEKLNKSKKLIAFMISQSIPFKYLLDVRFIRDDYYKDLDKFNEIVTQIDSQRQNQSKRKTNIYHSNSELVEQIREYIYSSDQYSKDIMKEISNNLEFNSHSLSMIKSSLVKLLKQTTNKSFSEFMDEIKDYPEVNNIQFMENIRVYFNSLKSIVDSYDNNTEEDPDQLANEAESRKESKFYSKHNLKPSSVSKQEEYSEEAFIKQQEDESKIKLNDYQQKQKERAKLDLLLKFNLSDESLNKNNILPSKEEMISNFSKVYKREIPNDTIETVNNQKVLKSNYLGADLKSDLKRIRKQSILNNIQEDENKVLFEKMLLNGQKAIKSNKKAIDFWKNLEKNY